MKRSCNDSVKEEIKGCVWWVCKYRNGGWFVIRRVKEGYVRLLLRLEKKKRKKVGD
jgi:hypothetical protein